jgi:hypothetical protein
MHQGRLLPLQIIRLEPTPGNTADCRHIGVADDGLPWAIKRVADGRYIPLSEYVCTHLAAAAGIAVPPCEIAELPNGEMAFASRWEGGTLCDNEIRRQFLQRGAIMPDALWRIHAFDLFVANPDRHVGNYLVREDNAFPGQPQCLAFDFSRALCAAACPVPSLPLHPGCNTMKLWPAVVSIHGTARNAALSTIDRIRTLPDDSVQRLCHALPESWADAQALDRLYHWWNDSRPARLDQIADYIRQGTP